MKHLLVILLTLICGMVSFAATTPCTLSLLPMPQKCSFSGKMVDGRKSVVERYVDKVEGARFQEEAYHILITSKTILLEATTPKGMYWVRQTLEQLKTTKNKKTCPSTDRDHAR